MRCNKDELLKRLEAMAKRGTSSARPGGAKRDMVDFDDLIVVPAETIHERGGDIGTEVSIGIKRYTSHPLSLSIPLYISDMSFGEIGRPAKAALVYGATLAKTMLLCGHVRLKNALT